MWVVFVFLFFMCIVVLKVDDVFIVRGFSRKRVKCEIRRRWIVEMVVDFEVVVECLGGVDVVMGKKFVEVLFVYDVMWD